MRRILVTGANKGIGPAIVNAILSEHDDTFVDEASPPHDRGADSPQHTHATRHFPRKPPKSRDIAQYDLFDCGAVSPVRSASLLEDDGALALDLKRALAPFGCEVTIIPDGNAGLARAVSDRFDMILLSAELKGMNGFRLCNRLKKDAVAKDVPVLMMCAASSTGALDAHAALLMRADSYLKKPFSPSDLRGQVRAFVPVLAQHRTLDTPAIVPPGRAARTQPAADAAMRVDRLQRELEAARTEENVVGPLRERLSRFEAQNAKLLLELQAARAAPAATPTGTADRQDPVGARTHARELLSMRGPPRASRIDARSLKRDLGTRAAPSAGGGERC